jgi:hypothetical protein
MEYVPLMAPASMSPSWYVNHAQAYGSTAGLMDFHPQGYLDAQQPSGTWPLPNNAGSGRWPFNVNFTPYANWIFGVYAAAAGVPLSRALWGANKVAGLHKYDKKFPIGGGGKDYSNMLTANYVNVVMGYYAFLSGTVCGPAT